jgi:hypothetical protein
MNATSLFVHDTYALRSEQGQFEGCMYRSSGCSVSEDCDPAWPAGVLVRPGGVRDETGVVSRV